MKSTRILPLLLATVVLSTAAVALALEELEKFRSDHFFIRYLPSWRLKDETGTQFYVDRVYSPSSTASLSVAVARMSGPAAAPLEAALAKGGESLAENFAREARQNVPSYRIVSHETTLLGGHPAFSFTATYTMESLGNEIPIRSTTVMAVRNGFGYRVFFEASDSAFSRSEGDFNAMLSTFIYTTP